MSLFTEGGDGVLERIGADPENASPVDRYLFGLASIIASAHPDAAEVGDEVKEALFSQGTTVLMKALADIRVDDELAEGDKLFLSFQSLREIDFENLPVSEETNRLFAMNMLTMMMGFETHFRSEIDRRWESIRISHLELAAMFTLSGKRKKLSSREQLEYLEERLSTMEDTDEEIDNELILRWGQRLVKEGAGLDDVFEMADYFKERDDNESAVELHTSFLERELVPQPK